MAYRPHWFTRRYRLLYIYMSLTSHIIFLCLRTSICTCEYVDSNIRSSRFTCAVCMRMMIPTPEPGLTVDAVGFMNQVLPTPERWIAESKYAPRRIGCEECRQWWIFAPISSEARGAAEQRIYHGTSLGVACRILQDGLVAGHGHHSDPRSSETIEGFFFIEALINHWEALWEALSRSTSSRCLEFQKTGWPSGWSCPVVLSFPYSGSLVHLKYVGHCRKVAIKGKPGAKLLLSGAHLYVDPRLLRNYVGLQQLQLAMPVTSLREKVMVCGGREDDCLQGFRKYSCGEHAHYSNIGDLLVLNWDKSNEGHWYCCEFCRTSWPQIPRRTIVGV